MTNEHTSCADVDAEIKRLKAEVDRLNSVLKIAYDRIQRHIENESRALADWQALRKENDALRAENARLKNSGG